MCSHREMNQPQNPASTGVAVPGHCDRRPLTRRVIGWAIDEHMRTDLVQDALAMAIALRGELPEQVVFHSDRGTQYASAQITEFADQNGITRSMGLTGICWGCQAFSVESGLDSEVLAVAA